MKSIWTLINDLEEEFPLNAGRCRLILSQSDSILALRTYLDGVLNQLENGNKDFVPEALSVAIPLSYRLALDDSAANYRISSTLKDHAINLYYPHELNCVGEEISWMCLSACGISYAGLQDSLLNLIENFKSFSGSLKGRWHVYGRDKSIPSILNKLTQFHFENKKPKNQETNILNGIRTFLNQFEEQVGYRIANTNINFKPYDFSTLKWLIPDLLALTLQGSDEERLSRNFGSAKSIYQSIFKRLEILPYHTYFGPSYSDKWHINRMVCYIQDIDHLTNQKLSFELFVRTDVDYFVGYGNYWRYKGLTLFAAKTRETTRYRRYFLHRIRSFSSFSQVQEFLFMEVTTGQLDLF